MRLSAAPAPWPPWLQPPERLAAGSGALAVEPALAWLRGLGLQWRLPPETGFALALCADEALTNIAAHARAAEGAPPRIWLACGRLAQGLGLWIADDGAAFDPTAQASPGLAPSLDDARPGGHGLRLLRHYAGAMHYRRTGRRNELLLVFPASPQAATASRSG